MQFTQFFEHRDYEYDTSHIDMLSFLMNIVWLKEPVIWYAATMLNAALLYHPHINSVRTLPVQ